MRRTYTNTGGDSATAIHDPITKKIWCSRLNGRNKHRTVFSKSVDRVRSGESVSRDAVMRTMAKIANRNETELSKPRKKEKKRKN